MKMWSTCDLMHVQDEPGEVADDEDGDDEHEDDRHVVVFPASAPHLPSDQSNWSIFKWTCDLTFFGQTKNHTNIGEIYIFVKT